MATSSLTIALERFTTFGDLLRYLRRRAGLTQRELSIAVGYSDAQISRLEQNERLPDLATITARFLPVLMLEEHPQVAERLLELAASVRREDAPAAGLPPYKGLYFFDESDAEMFFGREDLTTALVERITSGLEDDQRFLAVIGASGSGKSSVVRAGLVPALRWQPPSSSWPVYILTPTARPLQSLAEALVSQASTHPPAHRMVANFSSHAHGLQQTLARQAEAAGAEHSLLVVDQFEELFTLCHSGAEQAAFVENLLTAAQQPGGKAIVILVMRADFYAHCSRFDQLRQALARSQEYIGPMRMDDLRRAIEEPANRGNWELEPGLVELLLHDVGADAGRSPEPGALPLLSHALLETWKRRRGRTLTLSGYTASGGVRGAIAETAEAVFHDQLDPRERAIARQIFLRLTELGGDAATADTRRRVSFEELVGRPEDRDTTHQVLVTLADARLVTTEQDTAEVAHEALIREWPTLRGWLEEDREGLRLHRHLTEAAQDWDETRRDPSGLYRGAKLAQAVEWSLAHASDMNALEQTFLEASSALAEKENRDREAQRQRELEAARRLAETEQKRAEEQARSNQRLRRRALYLALAFIFAGVLAVTAGTFWQRAVQAGRLATSRELAAAAVNNLQVDPERSVLLALQALETENTLEARNALHQAVPELHLLFTIDARHDAGASGVAYSPDGTRLASLGNFSDIKVWEAATGHLLLARPAEADEYGYSIAYSPDGKLLAAALRKAVIFLDPTNGQELYRLEGGVEGAPSNEVVRISFSPDGGRLAVANMDGTPVVFDLARRAAILSLVGHDSPCDGVAYSPDGSQIATSDDTGVVMTWDAASGEALLRLVHSGNVHSVAFSPDGEKLVSASEDGSLKVWEAATGKELYRLSGFSGSYSVTFTPDGQRVVAGGQDGTVRVWAADTGQLLSTLAGNTSTVITVVTSPDGARIVSSGYDGSLKVWDASPGHELATIPAHAATAWDVAYTPDGRLLASAGEDGHVHLWDPATGRLVRTLSAGDPLSSLAIDPAGERLAAGSMAGNLYLWEIESGQLIRTIPGHTFLVMGLTFSPDGQRLLSSSWDGFTRLWEVADGRQILEIAEQGGDTAFSPDGKSLFTTGPDRLVHRWEAATGRETGRYAESTQDIYGIMVSPDGRLLATGLQDGKIVLWEVETGEQLRTLAGHAGLVLHLDFSRDGARLASVSFDRLAKVWDVASGEELFSLYGHLSNAFGVAFSPDGQTLATSGADGTVRTFTMQLEDLVALARSRLTRGLTAEECQKYLHGECR